MITVEEAKKITDAITDVVSALSDMSEEAAKQGVIVRFEATLDRSVDYPYHHIFVESAALDLNWLTPAEIERLAAEDG